MDGAPFFLAFCSPGRNNFAAGGDMDLDIPSILNYNMAKSTVDFSGSHSLFSISMAILAL